MTQVPTHHRPRCARLAPLVLLALLAATGLSTLHHHAGELHHPCAVCTLGQGPATVERVAPAPAVPERWTGAGLRAVDGPAAEWSRARPSSRAPPRG